MTFRVQDRERYRSSALLQSAAVAGQEACGE
jgi:hypothetical protein